jgi:HlyD family secretion protein
MIIHSQSAQCWLMSRTMMKKIKKTHLIVILLVLVAVLAGIWLWQSSRLKASENELVLYGNVDIRQVDLAFNAYERILGVLAEEGDSVEEGQLLATLETERLAHELSRAKALEQSQREVVAALEAGTRPEEIRKAQADVKAAEAEANNAAINYDRMKSLADEGFVTIQHTDDAKASAEEATARLQAAREELELAIIGPRKEDIAAAKATLKAYEEARAVAQRKLEDTNLYAPSDGVIQNRIMEPGDMASPQKTVFTLALTNPVWVRAYVPENDLGKVKLGMKAEISTDSYPGKTYAGWVGFLSPTAEFTPKTIETKELRSKLVYQIRIYVCNPNNELRLGMPATVTIPLDQVLENRAPDPDRCKNP